MATGWGAGASPGGPVVREEVSLWSAMRKGEQVQEVLRRGCIPVGLQGGNWIALRNDARLAADRLAWMTEANVRKEDYVLVEIVFTVRGIGHHITLGTLEAWPWHSA